MFVICTLHNASDEINGIAFEDHPDGKVSVEAVPEDVAAVFETIPGYKIVKSKKSDAKAKAEANDDADASVKSNAEAKK